MEVYTTKQYIYGSVYYKTSMEVYTTKQYI
jgi:hypothetical protein